MNGVARIVLALVLALLGVGALVVRVQAVGELSQPMLIVVSSIGVIALMAAFAVLRGGRPPRGR